MTVEIHLAAPSLTAMLAEYKIDNRRILRLVLEFIVRSAKAICPESEDPSQISSAIISASLNPDMDKQIETNNESLFSHVVSLIRRCDFSSELSFRVTLPVALSDHREALLGITKSQKGKKMFEKQQNSKSRIMALVCGNSKEVSSEQRAKMLSSFSVYQLY